MIIHSLMKCNVCKLLNLTLCVLAVMLTNILRVGSQDYNQNLLYLISEI